MSVAKTQNKTKSHCDEIKEPIKVDRFEKYVRFKMVRNWGQIEFWQEEQESIVKDNSSSTWKTE